MNYVFVGWYVAIMGGFIVPTVSQWLKTPKMSRTQKFLIVVGLSLLTGAAGYPLSGYSFTDVTFLIPGIISLAISAYELWWKKAFEDSEVAKRLGLKKMAKKSK